MMEDSGVRVEETGKRGGESAPRACSKLSRAGVGATIVSMRTTKVLMTRGCGRKEKD